MGGVAEPVCMCACVRVRGRGRGRVRVGKVPCQMPCQMPCQVPCRAWCRACSIVGHAARLTAHCTLHTLYVPEPRLEVILDVA